MSETRYPMTDLIESAEITPISDLLFNCANNIDRQGEGEPRTMIDAYSRGLSEGFMMALRMMEAGKVTALEER